MHYKEYQLSAKSLYIYNTIFTNAFSASLGSLVGGNLSDNFSVVSGLKTLPAVIAGGKPSPPVTDNCAFHTLFK